MGVSRSLEAQELWDMPTVIIYEYFLTPEQLAAQERQREEREREEQEKRKQEREEREEREKRKQEREERELEERQRLEREKQERLEALPFLRHMQLIQTLLSPPEGILLTLLSCFIFIMLAVLALELIGWFIFLGLLVTIRAFFSSQHMPYSPICS
ncbi:hypothetical protein MSAN_00259100 [Mycena sanguinolenta]|uniref:Uncharacterized protein n=1 Tax=Mycena sanguinolenta TaxID=230812 RepID=A0A8H6ZK15_9AGAR|nr:hypothetical protein MSAN_00259100 [Mycena sanguinolenta]